ncbi:uncharacterized protein DS421_3g86310 [Arachis hypogaea]|nr:uncharacterized protein DS421_3g86310 [Arachis hypogaea]
MAHSSTSPSKKTQTVKLRAAFQTEEIELVAEISRNHQQMIELSINNFKRKRRNITQVKMEGKNQDAKNQTKDLKCATHLSSEKFRNMSDEKKTIVRDLGFGGLMHIPPLRVQHKILKELANSFKLGKNTLETSYDLFKVRPKTIGAALGLNASRSPHVQEDFHPLYTDGVPVTNHNKQNLSCAPGTNFLDGHNNRAELGAHEIVKMAETKEKMKQIKKKQKKKKKPKKQKRKASSSSSSSSSSSESETTESEDHSTFESETEEDSEDPTRKQPTRKAKKMESRKRKKIQEDSDSESESNDESEESSSVEKQKTKKKTNRTSQKTQSKKKKVVVEESSPEQAQYYDGSEIETQELEEILRESRKKKNNEKSAALGKRKLICDRRKLTMSRLKRKKLYLIKSCYPDLTVWFSLVEELASEPAEENMMVVREKTQSEVLATTPEPPQKPEESTPALPPTPSKINSAPEDAAALMMMVRTASYVHKIDPMPSFSLGLTDSSQEEVATQEGAATQDEERAKTPETLKLLE